MNTFPSNVKQKFNSTIPDMADHPWLFTPKNYLRCSIYIITNNTIIYDYPKKQNARSASILLSCILLPVYCCTYTLP